MHFTFDNKKLRRDWQNMYKSSKKCPNYCTFFHIFPHCGLALKSKAITVEWQNIFWRTSQISLSLLFVVVVAVVGKLPILIAQILFFSLKKIIAFSEKFKQNKKNWIPSKQLVKFHHTWAMIIRFLKIFLDLYSKIILCIPN